jgi:hypothetical protein
VQTDDFTLDNCSTDDVLGFNFDGTAVRLSGVNRCDPYEPAVLNEGVISWFLTNQEQSLVVVEKGFDSVLEEDRNGNIIDKEIEVNFGNTFDVLKLTTDSLLLQAEYRSEYGQDTRFFNYLYVSEK